MSNPLLLHAKALIGSVISVDVSTGDSDFDHRIFATLIGVQDQGEGVVLLAEEESRNFNDPAPGPVLGELKALANRYPPRSLERIRMLRVVRAFEEQEAAIEAHKADLQRQ